MKQSDPAGQALLATPRDKKFQPQTSGADEAPGARSLASAAQDRLCAGRAPRIFVFNPFAEGYIARGSAFTPVRHQVLLGEDLTNLPQFLARPDDIVLVSKAPAAGFLAGLRRAGLPVPKFVELKGGRIDPAEGLGERKLGGLRPWAWGPDSVKLLEPLFARVSGEGANPSRCYNDDIARLYSKAWSADFLRKVLARWGGGEPWLCSEREAGVAVETPEEALKAVAAIRSRGHHRVVVKEAHGLAGHNALRLWEPEVLPTQRQWLAHALRDGRQLVVEPWLERVLDFSVQLEMGTRDLKLRGYSGLINDRKGQFLANWAEPDYSGVCRRKWPGGSAPPIPRSGSSVSTTESSACSKPNCSARA